MDEEGHAGARESYAVEGKRRDGRRGEERDLARVWHTGLPVKTCEGRHQMIFRTRLSRSAAHTPRPGKIETRERITGMGRAVGEDGEDKAMAPRSFSTSSGSARENWKASWGLLRRGEEFRKGPTFSRNFKWAPRELGSPYPAGRGRIPPGRAFHVPRSEKRAGGFDLRSYRRRIVVRRVVRPIAGFYSSQSIPCGADRPTNSKSHRFPA